MLLPIMLFVTSAFAFTRVLPRRGATALLSSTSASPSSAFLLTYGYVEGILEKRAPHRSGHIALLTELQNKGQLKAAGAFNPATGAAFIFTAPRDVVQTFVDSDPYVKAGLVTSHQIQEWTIAVGKL